MRKNFIELSQAHIVSLLCPFLVIVGVTIATTVQNDNFQMLNIKVIYLSNTLYNNARYNDLHV